MCNMWSSLIVHSFRRRVLLVFLHKALMEDLETGQEVLQFLHRGQDRHSENRVTKIRHAGKLN